MLHSRVCVVRCAAAFIDKKQFRWNKNPKSNYGPPCSANGAGLDLNRILRALI